MNLIRPSFYPLILAAVTLLVFSPATIAGFNSLDDPGLVNALANSNGWSLKEIFFPGYGHYYRPLLISSFYADLALWDLSPQIMHLENVLLHLANVLLVYSIAKKILPGKHDTRCQWALSAALLFGCHPVVTESVNWVSGRTDVLAGFFILLSIYFLTQSLDGGRQYMLLCSGFAFLLACLVKEVAVFYYPGALFLSATFRCQETGLWHRLRLRKLQLFTISGFCATYFMIRHFALRGAESGVGAISAELQEQSYNLLDTARICLKVMGFYAKKLFVPWPLNFAISNVSGLYVLVGVALVLVVIWLLVRADLTAAFFVTSACIASSALLVALGDVAWTPIAERYLYIATAPFVLGTVNGLYQVRQQFTAGMHWRYGLLLVLAVFGVSTFQRNLVWQDNLLLFEDTVKKSPEFVPAQSHLADALIKRGRLEEAKSLIAKVYTETQEYDYRFGIVNQVRAMAHEGDLEEARNLLQSVIVKTQRVNPVFLQELIAINLERLSKVDSPSLKKPIYRENLELLLKYQEMHPDPFNFYRIGKMYLALGEEPEANRYFSQAYQQAPENAFYKEPTRKLAESTGGAK